jgi:hypothetical protein
MAGTRLTSARATKLRSTELPYQEAVSMFLRNCVTRNLPSNTIVYYRNGMSAAISTDTEFSILWIHNPRLQVSEEKWCKMWGRGLAGESTRRAVDAQSRSVPFSIKEN